MKANNRTKFLYAGLLGCCIFGTGCIADPWLEDVDTLQQPIKAPIDQAICQINVQGHGVKPMETDYLPKVVMCENGGAGFEALKVQAISARSVAYYSMIKHGKICATSHCQVYGCGRTPTDLVRRAVQETEGVYLSYNKMLTYGFYVAGDKNTKAPFCKGDINNSKTEKHITYNEGKSGGDVTQTGLGLKGDPLFGQNRGCMGQYGSRCLEGKGYDYKKILRFYYGEDIGITQADGPCVNAKLEAELVGVGSDATEKGDGVYEVCTGSRFSFWFDFQNIGTRPWTDQSGTSPGTGVRLGVPGSEADPLTGETRISLNDTMNTNVVSDGPNCIDEAGCNTVRFMGENGITATAPAMPGTYVTKWQLVDRNTNWFGPVASLSFVVKSCEAPPSVNDGGSGDGSVVTPDSAAADEEDASGDGGRHRKDGAASEDDDAYSDGSCALVASPGKDVKAPWWLIGGVGWLWLRRSRRAHRAR